MHSDRELLALAAKAAGLQLCGYSWIGENEDDDECEVLESAFVKLHPEQELAARWNPLTDDGDALRLAVKMGIYVHCRAGSMVTSAIGDGDEWVIENWSNDPTSATRRAITRAAAQIGKGMK